MLNDDEHLEEDDMQVSIGDRPLLRRYEGRFLTIKEAAEILRVSTRTIHSWIEAGLLEAAKLPQKPGAKKVYYRIRGRAVDAIINQTEKPKE